MFCEQACPYDSVMVPHVAASSVLEPLHAPTTPNTALLASSAQNGAERHGWHCVLLSCVQGFLTNWPAGHSEHGVHSCMVLGGLQAVVS